MMNEIHKILFEHEKDGAMSNYFYPATFTKPVDLTNGNYGVWKKQLYYNANGSIGIVRSDKFIFYETNEKILYKVSCGELEKICCSSILFNIETSEWTLFKKVSRACDSECYTTLDQVVCSCDTDKEFCYQNVNDGFSNTLTGVSNYSSGNYNTVAGIYETVESEANFIPAFTIEVGGITLINTGTPDVYRLTIPGDFVAPLIGCTKILLYYADRWYQSSVRSTPSVTLTSGNTVLEIGLTRTCNDLPPIGTISKIIGTSNANDTMHGAGNIVAGYNPFNRGSFQAIFGDINNLYSGSFNTINGQNNGYKVAFTVTSGVAAISPDIISNLYLDKDFRIAAIRLSDLTHYYGTIKRVSGIPSDIINTSLPDGQYNIIFSDAIRVTSLGGGLVSLDILIPYLVQIGLGGRFPSMFIVNGKSDSSLVYQTYILLHLGSNQYQIYNFNPDDPTLSTPLDFTGYVRLENSKSTIFGDSSRLSGRGLMSMGDINIINGQLSMCLGKDNFLESAGYGNLIMGSTNSLRYEQSRGVILSGRANNYTTREWGVAPNNISPVSASGVHSLLMGEANSTIGSYNINVGRAGFSPYSYSLGISHFDRSRNFTAGNISAGTVQPYTGFTGSFINGIPVIAGTQGNLIRNVPTPAVGTAIATNGFNTDTNIFRVSFPDAARYEFTPTFNNQIPLEASKQYRITLKAAINVSNQIASSYFCPTYEICFITSPTGEIDIGTLNPNVFKNNQCVYAVNPVYTLPGASATPLEPSVLLFVNQPYPYFFEICGVLFNSVALTVNGAVDIDITVRARA
jgi:hypothetical protein